MGGEGNLKAALGAIAGFSISSRAPLPYIGRSTVESRSVNMLCPVKGPNESSGLAPCWL